MRFDPVSDRRNFTTVANPDRLKQQDEEAHASAHHGFAPELQAEMDKVAWCDVLVFQFPLWWLGMPAILIRMGGSRLRGRPRLWRRGLLRQRRVRRPARPVRAGPSAGRGPRTRTRGCTALAAVLFPIRHGIPAFTGFTVPEPFAVHAPARMSDAERSAALRRYGERLLSLDDGGNTVGRARRTPQLR